MPAAAHGRWVGAPITRKEDRRLLQGRGRFVGDMTRAGMLHAAFVRSPFPAACVTGIDTSAARVAPGVTAVFTSADLGDPFLLATLERDEFVPTRMPLLAGEQVRFAGEPVAMAVAADAYLAEDAAELVEVDWAPGPAVAGLAAARADGAPQVHPETSGNCLVDLLMFDDGKLAAIFAGAALVVGGVFTSARVAAMPLEGRACLAEWDDRDEQLVLHVSTQVPHQVRSGVAQALGIPERMIRVLAPDVGGGFGLKCVVGREEAAVAAAALRLRRPVRWTEDRQENLSASFHGHEQRYQVRAAFDGEGRILGLDAEIDCDIGAYSAYPFTCAVEPLMAAGELPGIYKVPAYRARGRGIATHKAPTAPYRGVSRPQIVLVMERLMEKAARELRLDPLDVRRLNMIGPGEFPYVGVNMISYDEGSYRESLDLAEQRVASAGWLAERDRLRAAGMLAGIGYACFSERTAYGTPTMSLRKMRMTPGYDTASVRMDPTGEVIVTTGTAAHGQGHETTFAQIVADRLGVHPDQVRLRQGDTDLASYGWGTFASRSIVIGGGAAARAAEQVAEQLRTAAAHLLEASAADVELHEGMARIRGDARAAIPLAEIARVVHFQTHLLPGEVRYGLEARVSYDPPGTFSNACHAALAAIDPGTGQVKMLRYLVVEDCGVVINPLIVDGQVLGGVTQGVAAALYERICYDAEGQPVSTTLMDYLVPTAAEMCPVAVIHLQTPSAFSESGAKGMGEGGMIGAPATVLNAVNDALGAAGVSFDHIPVLPGEICAALAGVKGEGEAGGVTDRHQVRLRVNGTEHELLVEARRTLADMLRHDLGYTGTNVGCEHGICGACTVRLDGAPVRSCLVFGVQADGAEVRTVESLADGDELSDLQQAFRDHHALQCGFCTPGFLMLAEAYFAERGLVQPVLPTGQPPSGADEEPPSGADGGQPLGADEGPSEAEMRELAASNLCRCTGYQGIVAAMLATARSRRAAGRRVSGKPQMGHPPTATAGVPPPPGRTPPRLRRGIPAANSASPGGRPAGPPGVPPAPPFRAPPARPREPPRADRPRGGHDMTLTGTAVPRKEDPRLLRGRGAFTDGFHAHGELWARVVRSPVAHGTVRTVDVARARQATGVRAVVTAADLPPGLAIPVRLALRDLPLTDYLQPVLADGVVRYVGEPLAVVVAEDAYAAEDAAELVDIDIDPLPTVLTAASSAAAGAPLLFPAGNVAADVSMGYGDTEAGFARAAHVTETVIEIGRHTAVPLEPRALLAEPDPRTGGLSITGMTKVPVFNRDVLAGMLGIDETLIHVRAVDTGGGFGVRGEFYPEDYLVPWLARTLGRPVKWAEDRAEHLVAANHSRQQVHRISAAFDAAGRILALADDILHDNGAYCRTHGITVPELTVAMLPGPYRVPAFRGRIRVLLTNKTPCGTYRAPGRFEGTTAREQLLDVAAGQLGIGRAELRRRNLLGPRELPCRRPLTTLGTDVVLDAGDYPALLAAAEAEASRLGYPAVVADGRVAGRRRGLGLGVFLEKSGLGPQDTADVVVSKAGVVHVYSGGTSLGQGIETVLAQIAADALGVGFDAVHVVNGDTALQPFGSGSWASRSTVVAGNAVHAAATAVAGRARQLAARMLEAAEDDLVAADGTITVRGDPRSAVTLAQIARAAAPASGYLHPGEPAGLAARRRFDVTHMTYPYGVHIAVAEVDPGTGEVRVLRYLVAYEVGRAVNPALVEGQLRGGVAQGIGGSLLEEFSYDEAGQPQAVTFMDYRMPTAAEIPSIDVLVAQQAPAPGNPLGVMGAGEGGISAAGAAVASAVRDALGLAGSVGRLPLTPARVAALAEPDAVAGMSPRAGQQPSAIRRPLSATGSVTPQPPGRTPQRSTLRLPGGEALPVPGASPRTPLPPEAREAPQGGPPAREAM